MLINGLAVKSIIFLLILIARSSLRAMALIPQHQMVSACVLRLWGMQIDATPERGFFDCRDCWSTTYEDMTGYLSPEEQEEYEQVLDEQFKDTGININDLV